MTRQYLVTALAVSVGFATVVRGAIMRVDFAGTFDTPAGSTPGIQGTPFPGASLTAQTPFDGFFTYDSSVSPTATFPGTNVYANSLLSFQATLHPSSGALVISADQFTGIFAIPNGTGTRNLSLSQSVSDSTTGEDFFGTTCGRTDASGLSRVHILLDLATATGESAYSGLALPQSFDGSKFLTGFSTFRLVTNFTGQRATGGLTSVTISQVPSPTGAISVLAGLTVLAARRRRVR